MRTKEEILEPIDPDDLTTRTEVLFLILEILVDIRDEMCRVEISGEEVS